MKIRRMIALACFLCFLAGCGGGPTPATTEPSETAAPVSDTLNLWCFEAGKADAFLLWNESGAVLIDTGESGFGKTILEKLSELGIERLDYLIVTHFDKDHVGGAKKLLSAIPVGTVLQSNCPKTGADAYEKYVAALAAAGIEASTVRQTLRFTLGDVRFTVDPPAAEHYETDASNNSSLIVSVTHGADSLLFCGDAEDLRLAEFLETNPGKYDLVKLPHHGRWQSTLEQLLEQTQPTWTVITSSDEEPEDPETLALLNRSGIQTILTREGALLITSEGNGVTVHRETTGK